MMRRLVLRFVTCLGLVLLNAFSSWAQLSDGSIAPDFTATDIYGVEHNLYSYLDSGYQVILGFHATWCGPCWNYHTSGVYEELNTLYGPNGTNEIRILLLESDDTTTSEDLNGEGSNTQGDWVTGTSSTIIDSAANIFDEYANTYFPTVYTVCPNKILMQSGQVSVVEHESILQATACTPASFPNDALLMDYVGQTRTCSQDPAALSVRLMNKGLDILTSCTIQVSKLLPLNQTEVVGSVNWQGELGTYEFTTVELFDVTVDGETTFVFEVISADDNAGNNTTQGTVWTSEEVATNLEVRLKTDGAPEQLGWTISDQTGFVVASVLPGSQNLEANTEYAWNVTIPELGCHTLTLLDEGGDGLFNLATSMDDVGFLEVNSVAGETVLDQDWFYQELDAFFEVTFDMEVVQMMFPGCTDLNACNFSPGATEDDGTCDYSCFGCTDPEALNWDEAATVDDGSCTYFETSCAFIGSEEWAGLGAGLFAEVEVLTHEFGVFGDGALVLSLPEVMEEPATGNAFAVMAWNDLTVSGLPNGFTLSNAPTSMDPGTQVCLTYSGTPVEEGMFDVLVSGELVLSVFGQPYPVGPYSSTVPMLITPNVSGIVGCTYPNATNYLSYATIESGTCTFEGCMDPEANNFQTFALSDNGSCVYESCSDECPSDLDGDGAVGTGDLLALLSSFGLICN